MTTKELSKIEDAVVDAWQAIAPDLSSAAAAWGEKRIHVDDLADAISNHLKQPPLEDTIKWFAAIKKAIRTHISNGSTYIHF